MKKLLTILLVTFALIANAQSVTLSPQTQTLNIRGGEISKGDTVQLALNYYAPGLNGANPTQFYFDFQHQFIGYTLANVTFPIAGANGSSLPANTKTSYSNNYYPGYSFIKNVNNTTVNGYQNASYSNYNYNPNSGVAIDRIMLTYSAPNNAPLRSGTLAYLNFVPTTSMPAGYAYDSVYLDFVYGWTSAGQVVTTITQPKPASAFIKVSSTSNALVNGSLRINPNLPSQYWPTIIFADSATNSTVASFTPSATGQFTVASEVLPNHTYKVYVQTPGAQAWQLMANSVTISDYTAAQNEFMHQTLTGQYTQTNIHTGIGYLAADVNFNGSFDGGDVAILFDNAVGNDSTTIITNGAITGLYGDPTMPVFNTSVYDTLGINAWGKYAAPNSNFVYYRTGTVAGPLSLAYVIPGDITRTFSSPVLAVGANGTTVVTNSIKLSGVPTLETIKSQAVNTGAAATGINVDISNTTVTSNSITIPIGVNTNGANLSALQFTFVYDTTKIKFNQLTSNVPNTWTTLVAAKNGIIKVTTLDKNLKSAMVGNSNPFSLNFTSIGNGLDLNTAINVLSNMDAADQNGKQLPITLNNTTIKLTGFNNF